MAAARWLTGIAVAVVVGGAAAGAVALWPADSGPRLSARHTSSPAPKPSVVDGIPNGTHVSATGTVVRLPGGAELCFDNGMVLDSAGGTETADCVGDVVQLRGRHVHSGNGDGRRRTVEGIWQSGAIVVTGVLPPKPDPDAMRLTHVPCPEPPGGWSPLANYDPRTPNIDYHAFELYRHTHRHVITSVASFRPPGFGPVLTLASTEPAATRAALAAAYPDALCVVASKHSWEEVARARHLNKALVQQHEQLGLNEVGQEVTADGQPAVEIGVRHDSPTLQALLRGIPADLIDLRPLIEILDQR